MQLFWMICYGIIGGVSFLWLKAPGGCMLGSMIGVIVFLFFGQSTGMERPHIPQVVEQGAYIAIGIVVGAMFRPELFRAFAANWHAVLISTLIVLAGGCLGAFILYKSGLLTPSGAYLAASPGGLNALTGIAAEMGEEAPVVLLCQMVRLYAILLTTPLIGKLLSVLFRH